MIIPLEKNLYQSPTSYFLNLIYDLMENIGGCETCNSEDINIDLLQKHDIVFIAEGAGFEHINLYKKLSMKIIVIYDDIHYWNNSGKEFIHNMFSKADVILLPYHKQFLKMKEYEPYHHKSIWFPFFENNKLEKFLTENNLKIIEKDGLGEYFLATRGFRPYFDTNLDWHNKYNEIAASEKMKNLMRLKSNFSRLQLWVIEK